MGKRPNFKLDLRRWRLRTNLLKQPILALKMAGDARGLTPLHEAARWGWNDVVGFLVESGANVNAKDSRGMTPIDSAMGRAGGNSRGGQRVDVHEDTAALLKKLALAGGQPTSGK